MSSHCLPNGFLGTGELAVPNISGSTLTVFNPPSGLRRGVFVLYHGLTQAYPVTAPFPVTDSYSSIGSAMFNTICANLAYDGWVVLVPPNQEDPNLISPYSGIYTDVQNDSGYGARWLTSTLHTFDHIRQYILNTYGNWPICVGGFSRGGWTSLVVAANRQSQLGGYFAHCPATYWENINTAYTPGYQFGNLNWSGADLGVTLLNTVTIPGMVGYGTGDVAVMYGGSSTVATNGINTGSGFNSTPAAAGSVTGLQVSTGSLNFNAGPLKITVVTSTGVACYTATYSAGVLTTTWIAGTGTVSVGAAVVQSSTDLMIYNAITAGQPVTRMSTTESHSLGVTDAGAYYTGSPTNASAFTGSQTLAITSTQAANSGSSPQYLISTKCAIMGTDGKWYAITFSTTSGSNLTNVTISTTPVGGGSGTGAIATNAPICNTGTAITGGYSNMSYPYWVNQTLDPSFPKTY